MTDDYITTAEAAKLLGVSDRSVNRRIAEGKIPGKRGIAKGDRCSTWRVARSHVDAILKSREQTKDELSSMKFAPPSAREAELNTTVSRLLTKLREEKVRTAKLVAAVERAATDAANGMSIPPVPTWKPRGTPKTRVAEVAVAMLSDVQYGKKTHGRGGYSMAVAEERVERYIDKVIEIAEIQRSHHPVNEARLYLLGDLVEGETVFPGQAHEIDGSLYAQMFGCAEMVARSIRRLRAHFAKVVVRDVDGNHGRIGRKGESHPETNADRMVSEIARKLVAQTPGIEWPVETTPGARNWYALDTVGAKTFLLIHGDQIRGHNGFPWYGQDRKVKGWAVAFERLLKERRADYVLHGHFHTPVSNYINGIRAWCNGSTESANAYALEQLAASGEPAQWLLFAHPSRGVTSEHLIQL